MNPPILDYENNTYISISTEQPPSKVIELIAQRVSPIEVTYVEKVGELKNEYLVAISIPTNILLNDSSRLPKLNQDLSSIEDMNKYSILQLPSQRSKRLFIEDPPVSSS